MDWNVVRFLVHFFFTFTLHWWPIAFLILSPLVQNCQVVLPTKKCLLCFLSLALDLCRPLSRWASLACRPLSLFLCLSLALYSQFVGMTNNLGVILYKTRIQKKIPLSVFVFIDSLVASASQDAGGYAISVKITSSYIWVAIPVEWVILHWYDCGADERSGGRSMYGHLITKFSWMGSLPHFLTHWILHCARSANITVKSNLVYKYSTD